MDITTHYLPPKNPVVDHEEPPSSSQAEPLSSTYVVSRRAREKVNQILALADTALLNRQIAYGAWFVCCVFWFVWIYSSERGFGPVSSHYAHYLVGQGALALGRIFLWHGVAAHGALQSALAYIHFAQTCSNHWSREPSARGFFWPKRVVLLLHLTLFVCQALAGATYHADMVAASVIYGPAALAAILAMLHFYLRVPSDSDAKSWLILGVIGGLFGIANLVWPSFVMGGEVAPFLSRIADCFLYVPLAATASLWMDKFIYDCDNCGEAPPGRSLGWLRVVIVACLLIVVSFPAYTIGRNLIADDSLCFVQEDFVEFPRECGRMGRDHVARLDRHTRVLYRVLKTLSPRYEPVPPGTIVEVPHEAPRKIPKQPLVRGLAIPQYDEDHERDTKDLVADALFEILRIESLHLFEDLPRGWESIDEAKAVITAAGKEDLAILRSANWSESTSDFAIERWAFAGLAAHRLQRNPDGSFVSDWRWMTGFEVRTGFERYGASAHFATDGKLNMIHWCAPNKDVFPGDPDWEHAKWVWKSTVLVGTTIRDHLVGVHWQAANTLTTATYETLNPDHPLRRLIKPFIWGTATINIGATKTLSVQNGLVHRAAALTFESLVGALSASVDMNRYVPPLEYFKKAGTDGLGEKYPWGRDMQDFTMVVYKYVSDYVDVFYKDDDSVLADTHVKSFWDGLRHQDNSGIPLLDSSAKRTLVEVLSGFITHVTAVHNHVGNVADYLHPDFVTTKLRPGAELADVQASFQALNIGLLTAMRHPKLMSDFSHLLLADRKNQTLPIMERFQAQLAQLSRDIDDRNTKRSMPCNSVNPILMPSSVSI